jgi:hypothetical protein
MAARAPAPERRTPALAVWRRSTILNLLSNSWVMVACPFGLHVDPLTMAERAISRLKQEVL